jgi:hypothetical protein
MNKYIMAPPLAILRNIGGRRWYCGEDDDESSVCAVAAAAGGGDSRI